MVHLNSVYHVKKDVTYVNKHNSAVNALKGTILIGLIIYVHKSVDISNFSIQLLAIALIVISNVIVVPDLL